MRNFFANQDGGIVYVVADKLAGHSEASVAQLVDYCRRNIRFYQSMKDDVDQLISDEQQQEIQTIIDNPPVTDAHLKLEGFEYNGVMCSATKDDQNGLVAIQVGFQSGLISSADFEFSNGSVLKLTADNLSDFSEKWAAFRQSFFSA